MPFTKLPMLNMRKEHTAACMLHSNDFRDLRISPYSFRMRQNVGKMRTWITPKTVTFYAVNIFSVFFPPFYHDHQIVANFSKILSMASKAYTKSLWKKPRLFSPKIKICNVNWNFPRNFAKIELCNPKNWITWSLLYKNQSNDLLCKSMD